MKAIGYTRVSTEEQARSGLGLDAQRERVAGEIAHRGWELAALLTDEGYSGKNLARPAITEALNLLRRGEADALVVAKLDRLSRSVLDFSALMKKSRREGWALVALDIGVDTSTPQGRMVANIFATFAEFERELIGERTRNALALKRRQGMRLGRPVELPDEVRARIAAEREAGDSLSEIARRLNTDKVPTARGGTWWPSTVAAVVKSVALDREASERAA